ncbi:RDD family protein [Aerococcus urinae]
MNFIRRILSAFIDIILIYFPTVLVMQISFKTNIFTADVIGQIFYILYSLFLGNYTNGKTIGKYFGKLRVCYYENSNKLIYIGLREVPKMLYFLPHVGFLFVMVSISIYLWKGLFLHDIIGRSYVIDDLEHDKEK